MALSEVDFKIQGIFRDLDFHRAHRYRLEQELLEESAVLRKLSSELCSLELERQKASTSAFLKEVHEGLAQMRVPAQSASSAQSSSGSA